MVHIIYWSYTLYWAVLSIYHRISCFLFLQSHAHTYPFSPPSTLLHPHNVVVYRLRCKLQAYLYAPRAFSLFYRLLYSFPVPHTPADLSSVCQLRTYLLAVAPAGQKSTPQADQYLKGTLERSQLSPSPFTQFHTWFTLAQSSGVYQPETVCLSTAHLPSGSVSSRYVYLKELDATGFIIYSNWGTSRKARDVESNPQASLAFWWHEMERQVRVEGPVERLSREESQRYFGVRARGSKIGAWASEQS